MKQLLKWAGGKSWLRETCAHLLPDPNTVSSYHEPFLGGAAVASHYIGKVPCMLSDKNKKLMVVYEAVKEDPDGVYFYLELEAAQHSKEHYYEVRDRFNRADRFEGDNPPEDDKSRLAARFIYLNRTCFNGLYRENKRGGFNVPCGDYKNPGFPMKEDIAAWAEMLQGKTALFAADFQVALSSPLIGPRSFVFLDPPYVPASESANFTEYQAGGFGPKDQAELADWLVRLDVAGACFLLTNDASARSLYEAWDVLEVEVPRAINSDSRGRGKVKEILVANYSIS